MNKCARILVIDDDPLTLHTTLRLLEKAGHQVIEATTGNECLRLAMEEKPDLILLDVVLPDLDSTEVCKRIKAESSLAGTFVVFVTSTRTAPEDQIQGYDCGADDYLLRPLADHELLARVQALLRAKRAEDKLRLQANELSKRRQTEEALRESSDRMRLAHQLARLGHWDWFMETNEIRWSPEVFGIFGQPKRFRPTVESFEAAIHPEDLGPFIAERERALAKDRDISIEHRIIWSDGTIHHVRELAEIIRDNQGQVVRVRGTVQDITERVQTREMLRAQAAQLEALRQVNLELAGTLDLEKLLRHIVLRATELLNGTAGGLYLYQPEFDVLRWAVSVGPNTSPIDTIIRHGEGMSGRVWQRGEPLIVDDYECWEGKLLSPQVHPWGSVLGVPIWHKPDSTDREFLGVLNVMVDSPRQFSPDDSQLLSQFAAQAAVAIRNARIYEQAQQEIAHRQQMQEDLQWQRNLLSQIMETSPIGIMVVNHQGTVVYANAQVAKILGIELARLLLVRHEDLPRHVASVLGQPLPMEKSPLVHAVKANAPMHNQRLDIELETGHRLSLSVSAAPLADESEEENRVVVVLENITAQVQAEEDLRASQERLSSTLSSMDDLVFVFDQDGAYVDFYQPTGPSELYLPPEAFLGKTIGEVMPPHITQAFQEAQKALLATGETQQFDYVLAAPHEEMWYSAKVSARVDSNGDFAGVTVVSRNITERKEAEERIRASLQEKEILLKEVHHRVKNNLQVVSSLLDMQAFSMQDAAAINALEDSQHRIRTMAFIHERLYQSDNLASVDVSEYLNSLASHLLTAYEGKSSYITLDTSIDPITLDLDSAIAVGLIVNELVSNCLKYAFPPAETQVGSIWVGLQVLDGDRIALEVRDNGIGLAQELVPQDAQSLGLRLVSMLTQQIHGTLEVDRSAGTAFRITFSSPEQGSPGEVS